jgi:hypothetical protein
MNHPLLAPIHRPLLVGIVAIALVSGGFFAWQRGRTSVPTEELAAFLDRTVDRDRVQFSEVRMEILQPERTDLRMAVDATARTIRPLYSPVDAADYLGRRFQLDPAATAEARRWLANQSLATNPEFKSVGPLPTDPYQASILQLRSPAGAPFKFRGVVDAHRDGDRWVLALSSGGFPDGAPAGEPRSAFADTAFVAGDTGDDSRLRVLTTDLLAFADRATAARRDAESARVAAVEGRQKAFQSQIAPGRVFRGLVLEGGQPQGTPLYLEIVASSSGNDVTALLHGEGSWHRARAFQGTWSADQGFENPVLSLNSRPDQAVGHGGPFLENTQTWSFALHPDPHGGLSDRSRHYQYQFQPLPPDQVPILKARLEEEFNGAMAATRPGLVYAGMASAKTSGASERILLHFASRSEGGESIEAAIESTARPWRRTLHGAILANSRRSGGEPVRLLTSSNEASEDAPVESVLGARDDLEIRLGSKNGALIGEDEQFRYQLAIASDADLRQLETDRADRRRRFLGLMRTGIVYDGVLRDPQGFTAQARLAIARFDRTTGAIAASIYSPDQLSFCGDYVGTCDPSAGSIALAKNAAGLATRGSPNSSDSRIAAAATLHLTLNGSSITGRIQGDVQWTIEFPAGTFLSTPTEGPEPDSPPANGSVFPSFPKVAGAYLLGQGGWAPLPRNGGHVVVETARADSGFRLPTNVIGAVEEGVEQLTKGRGKGKENGKRSYLEFDGKEARPKSSGPAMILLFIGPVPSETPPVELAPAEPMPDGRRRVALIGGSPAKVRFSGQRLAAYVRQVAPDSILLTTTSTLAPGPYVFNADAGYELTQE